MQSRKRRRVLAALSGILLLGITTIGVTAAYRSSSTETLVNVITAGSVAIALTETDWNAADASEMHPEEAVLKNPVITNTGENRAWVFLEVSIPVRTISVVGENNRKQAAAPCELFTYQVSGEAWELIATEQEETRVVRVYAFNRALNPKEKTPALFSGIKAVNYLEGELDVTEEFAVEISALAIQENVDTEENTPEQIYEMLLKQTAMNG